MQTSSAPVQLNPIASRTVDSERQTSADQTFRSFRSRSNYLGPMRIWALLDETRLYVDENALSDEKQQCH